jgi:hypothetical protein
MNQTNITDLTQDLQALEVHLKRVLELPAYHNLVESGFYSPDFTLVDALTAVQQAKENYDEMMSIVELYSN